MDDVVIRVDHLWKRYGLPLRPTLRRAMMRLRGDKPDRVIPGERWSLRDVSFAVNRGETLGIIGRNGAGKSTLLKVLTGVTPPTHGTVEVNGAVFPMIELNAGINTELTGRENVHLLAAVMGISRREIQEKLPEIEDFCELGDWFDEPVWKYSSGMLARLGFSVAVNVHSDILLIDEVLAVGDLRFQQKCYSRLAQIRESRDKVVILISHNLRQIARLCDTTFIMDAGEIVQRGSSETVVNQYMQDTFNAQNSAYIAPTIQSTGLVDLDSITLLNAAGEPVQAVRCGETITVRVELTARERLDNVVVGIGITSTDLLQLAGIDSWNIGHDHLHNKTIIECTIDNLKILPGMYFLNVGVTDSQQGARLLAARNLLTFQILTDDERYPTMRHTGIFALDTHWNFSEQPS